MSLRYWIEQFFSQIGRNGSSHCSNRFKFWNWFEQFCQFCSNQSKSVHLLLEPAKLKQFLNRIEQFLSWLKSKYEKISQKCSPLTPKSKITSITSYHNTKHHQNLGLNSREKSANIIKWEISKHLVPSSISSLNINQSLWAPDMQLFFVFLLIYS